jgi:hypothetical protein
MAKSRLLKVWRFTAFFFVTFMAGAVSTFSQAADDSCREQKAYSVVQRFFRAAYPDLPADKSELRITVSTPMSQSAQTFNDVAADVIGPRYESTKTSGEHVYRVETKSLLGGRFLLDPSEQIEQVSIEGAWVNWNKWTKILRLVDSHPEWTQAKANSALKEAGAKYGPSEKEQFTKNIPVENLADSLGKLTIRSADFAVLGKARKGNFSSLCWRVTLEAQPEGRPGATYYAVFEPFGGRLVWIGKSPPSTK